MFLYYTCVTVLKKKYVKALKILFIVGLHIKEYGLVKPISFMGNFQKKIFYSHADKSHFHKKDFTCSLVLKVRVLELGS